MLGVTSSQPTWRIKIAALKLLVYPLNWFKLLARPITGAEAFSSCWWQQVKTVLWSELTWFYWARRCGTVCGFVRLWTRVVLSPVLLRSSRTCSPVYQVSPGAQQMQWQHQSSRWQQDSPEPPEGATEPGQSSVHSGRLLLWKDRFISNQIPSYFQVGSCFFFLVVFFYIFINNVGNINVVHKHKKINDKKRNLPVRILYWQEIYLQRIVRY